MNNMYLVYNKNVKDKIDSQELLNGLYIIATPIGNMLDITIRAIEILRRSEVILCEDTRVTFRLLSFYGITPKKLICMNDIKENKSLENYINIIKENKMVSLVSDAGTPMISDPGFKLVRSIINEGGRVYSVPGPSASIAALVLSGFPTNSFLFCGFLNVKKGKKIKQLTALRNINTSIILYESPFKIISTLKAIREVFSGNLEISVSREITKKFEDTVRGNISEIIEKFEKSDTKGEFVIVINNNLD